MQEKYCLKYELNKYFTVGLLVHQKLFIILLLSIIYRYKEFFFGFAQVPFELELKYFIENRKFS